MYTCTHICTYVITLTHTNVYMYMHIYTHTICMHARTHARTHAHVRAHNRHGIFLPSELSSFSQLLRRLGRVHSLFTHPHPLTKLKSTELETTTIEEEDEGEHGEKAVMCLRDFHWAFLHYLIENRFVSLMYHYLDNYR